LAVSRRLARYRSLRSDSLSRFTPIVWRRNDWLVKGERLRRRRAVICWRSYRQLSIVGPPVQTHRYATRCIANPCDSRGAARFCAVEAFDSFGQPILADGGSGLALVSYLQSISSRYTNCGIHLIPMVILGPTLNPTAIATKFL
jgi:hypothetical protein